LHGKGLRLDIAGLPHPRIAPGKPFSLHDLILGIQQGDGYVAQGS
jgi:hypothetical protein